MSVFLFNNFFIFLGFQKERESKVLKMLENQHIITQEVAMRNADSIDRLAVNVGELSKAIAAIAESNNKVVAAFSPQYLN